MQSSESSQENVLSHELGVCDSPAASFQSGQSAVSHAVWWGEYCEEKKNWANTCKKIKFIYSFIAKLSLSHMEQIKRQTLIILYGL